MKKKETENKKDSKIEIENNSKEKNIAKKSNEDKREKKTVKRSIDRHSFEIIQNLFQLASEAVKEDKRLANRYVEIARKIAMAKQIRLPTELRRQFCTHCYSYLLPGYNCKVRISNNCAIYHCPYCKRMGKIRIKN